MKYMIILLLTMFFALPNAEGEETPSKPLLKYVDEDKDGINDFFRDADGDGINDVDSQPYDHRFPFVDDDGDGKNNIFRDADGNGVNDLAVSGLKTNDVRLIYLFIDADADSINDVTQQREVWQPYIGRGNNDYFIDNDGDGINDGRAFSRERRQRGKSGNNGNQGRRRNRGNR